MSRQFYLLRIFIFAVIYSIQLAHAFAAESTKTGPLPSSPSMSTPGVIAASVPPSEEIAVLRAQNKMIQDFQNSLLDTVLWALGGVCTVAVLVAGFGWWSNFKLYDADKKRLQDDFELRLAEVESRFEARNQSLVRDFERSMDAKIDGHLSRGAGELNAVKIELTGIKEKFDAVSARFNNEVNKWTVESGKLKKALSKGSSELRQVEEHIWDLRNIPGNILITQTQGLSADVELGDASRVKLTLGRMIATIQQNFVKKGKTLEEGDYAFLESRVKVAEAIAPIEVAEVLRRLDGVRPSAESRNADTSA